jgi:hypothetical protein
MQGAQGLSLCDRFGVLAILAVNLEMATPSRTVFLACFMHVLFGNFQHQP